MQQTANAHLHIAGERKPHTSTGKIILPKNKLILCRLFSYAHI